MRLYEYFKYHLDLKAMNPFHYFAENNWITKITFEGVSWKESLYSVEEMVVLEPIKCKGYMHKYTWGSPVLSPLGTHLFYCILFLSTAKIE